jgi:hypothetical protein
VYFAFAASVHAADCKWIDTVGEAAVENITPEEARQTALNRARIKAVETVSGLHVQGSSLVKDVTLITDFIRTLSMGYVLEEKIVGWNSRTVQEKPEAPPVTLYKVSMRSCVAAARLGDPYFRVRGEISRPVYVTGEEAVIKASCTKTCYLTILNLTADNKMKVLMPNTFEPAAHLAPDESYTFPQKGLSLEMSLLQGHKKDTEAFYLVATKEALNLSRLMKEDGEVSAKEFYSLLLSLPPETKAEELLVYEVRDKE